MTSNKKTTQIATEREIQELEKALAGATERSRLAKKAVKEAKAAAKQARRERKRARKALVAAQAEFEEQQLSATKQPKSSDEPTPRSAKETGVGLNVADSPEVPRRAPRKKAARAEPRARAPVAAAAQSESELPKTDAAADQQRSTDPDPS